MDYVNFIQLMEDKTTESMNGRNEFSVKTDQSVIFVGDLIWNNGVSWRLHSI